MGTGQQSFTAVGLTRRSLLGGLVITVGALAGVGLTACGGGAARTVDMSGLSRYEPVRVTIAPGETVSWRNASTIVHTVTCDPAKVLRPASVRLPSGAAPWDSGDVPPGASWSRRFDVSGEYQYCCLPHELAGMIGVVVVG